MNRDRSRSPMGNGDEEEDRDDNDRRNDRKKFDRSRVSGKKVPSDCRIYVSNIPYEYKWQDLKDLFRNEVGDVAYVEMFNDENGRPRGCAIVDFESPDMAQKAIDKMHRFEAKGRKLLVKEKEEIVNSREFTFLFQGDGPSNRDRGRFSRDVDRGRSFDRSPMPDMGPAKFGNTYGLSIAFLESLGINGPLVTKVFVANLDYKVTEEDLREVFKVAGKVTDGEVIKDLDGKSRGFGVVEFEHPVQAVQAISMLHNQVYFDRKLSVRLDRVAEKQKDQKSNSKLPPGLKGLGMGLGLNGEPIVDINNIAATVHNQANSMANMPSGMNLPSGNIDNANQGMNTVQMLGMAGIDPSNNPLAGAMGAVASNLSNALGLGMGQNMMNMAGLNPNPMNSGLPNNAFANQALNAAANAVSNAAGMGGYGNNSFGGGGGSSSTRDFSSSSSSSSYGLRSVVQISNLPLDYTWQNLRDLCRDYGEIRFAEMRSKGIGLIRFSAETGARRAADMLDRQRFDGRVLDARIL